MPPQKPRTTCERCGAPALVHIRPDAADPDNVRHFCLACADEEAILPVGAETAEPRLNRAAVLIAIGLTVLGVSAGADIIGFGRAEGFGWKQMSGVLAGGGLFMVGAIAQVPTILVVGAILGGITVLADWLHFGSGEGFGRHQITGCLLGTILVLCGFLAARRQSGNDVPDSRRGAPSDQDREVTD